MEQLIDFIIDLANEELYDYLDGNSKCFFMSGGCYEFVKVIIKYVNECKIVINKKRDHCGVLYMNKVYDATGIVSDSSKFEIAKQADKDYMEERFGIPEKLYVGVGENRKRISQFLIEEIKNCNIDYILKQFEENER